jgi:GNAT superfamily N-acetyltransferase
MTFADRQLAQRLERTEATACAQYVEARARKNPRSGAEWIDVGGTYAMFDTVESPITQSFGLGMFEPVTDESLAKLETFFRDHGATPHHEVSPIAGKDLAVFLSAKGYEPFEFTSVMYQILSEGAAANYDSKPIPSISIKNEPDADTWVAASVRGWSEFVEYAGVMEDLARTGFEREGAVSLLAEVDGQPAGTASLCIHEGVALMSGASTIPAFRNRGVQRALLNARVEHAIAAGCDLLMMCAEPGSASQRNAERVGFRIAYTRIKWRPRG